MKAIASLALEKDTAPESPPYLVSFNAFNVAAAPARSPRLA